MTLYKRGRNLAKQFTISRMSLSSGTFVGCGSSRIASTFSRLILTPLLLMIGPKTSISCLKLHLSLLSFNPDFSIVSRTLHKLLSCSSYIGKSQELR